ncbi:MAG: hypothetical protein H6587_06605 [Flavobacteriales bacterium]|nr:hypothetical protein [Flavobacteriales bacterium]MCB9364218.1 hypothetical protein [Flavobacteriales bacterium]
MLKKIKQNEIFILLLFYTIVATVILFSFNGTGENGSGDSISHYLYAKYAINNPALFLDHWAKPVFVLLAFPFAQIGFIGIKLFNVIVTFFTLLYTYKLAVNLNLKHPILAPLILLFTPLFFALTFSGLTEPLFALFTILSAYLFAKNKFLVGVIILSFLPFVRSEGLIIIGVFAFYLLIKKQWKFIPLFTIGHLVYSFIGYFHYHDILWVFNKIPYAKLSSTYGSGKITHFVHQLFYVIGAPIYILMVVGLLTIIVTFFKRTKKPFFNISNTLILGSFLSFFIAHSLFWYLGIFNSMGLKRVLISVAPFIALIAHYGLNLLSENKLLKNNILKTTIKTIFIAGVLILPFTSNKAAINWKHDFSLSDSQKLANECASYINSIKKSTNTFVFSDPYFSELLNINHFDKTIRRTLSNESLDDIKPNDLVIWDSWFGFVENGISEDKIKSFTSLSILKTFNHTEGNREIKFIVLKKK